GIRNGGALPPGAASAELIAALSQTTYTFRGDRLLLEDKDQVKARLGYSPDDADAFALTFAQPVAPRVHHYDRTMAKYASTIHDYDPLDDSPDNRRGYSTIHDYDPLEFDDG